MLLHHQLKRFSWCIALQSLVWWSWMVRVPLCPSLWRWPMIWHAVLKCTVLITYWLCQRSNLRWEFTPHNLFFLHCQHGLCVLPYVCTQLFTLPKVSSKSKLKLTAVDGSRVRRVGVAWFGSRTDEQLESSLVVLSNQGELHVISLPSIKMMVHYPCIRREDVSGIASCVFTKYGQGRKRSLLHTMHLLSLRWNGLSGHLLGFYLMSPSEFERFSLSTRSVVEPRCLVEAPLQMRPKNPSSPVHRDQPDGVPTEHRCVCVVVV